MVAECVAVRSRLRRTTPERALSIVWVLRELDCGSPLLFIFQLLKFSSIIPQFLTLPHGWPLTRVGGSALVSSNHCAWGITSMVDLSLMEFVTINHSIIDCLHGRPLTHGVGPARETRLSVDHVTFMDRPAASSLYLLSKLKIHPYTLAATKIV